MQWQCLFRCLELFDLLDDETNNQFDSFKTNTFRNEGNMVVPQLDSNLEASAPSLSDVLGREQAGSSLGWNFFPFFLPGVIQAYSLNYEGNTSYYEVINNCC